MATEYLIDDIKIGDRHRKDLGEELPASDPQSLDALVESIRLYGLLQPVVLNQNGELIAGFRRLAAAEKLEWTHIPAHVIDMNAIILGENAENENRKGFTLSERAAIGMEIEKLLGNRAGRPKTTEPEAKKEEPAKPDNCPQLRTIIPAPAEGEKNVEVAAKSAGMSRGTYERVKTVVAKAAPEVVKAMDTGDVSASDAAAIVNEPPDEQKAAVEDVKAGKAPTLTAAVASKRPRKEPNAFDDCVAHVHKLSRMVNELVAAQPNKQVHPIRTAIQEILNGIDKWRKTRAA